MNNEGFVSVMGLNFALISLFFLGASLQGCGSLLGKSAKNSDSTNQVILDTKKIALPQPTTSPTVSTPPSLEKLEVDPVFLPNGSFVAASIPGLRGKCVSGLKVFATGDLRSEQSTDCVNESFLFENFFLSDGDGEKNFTLTQSENGAVLYESKRVTVHRITTKLFKLPHDAVHPAPIHGLLATALNDIYIAGELMILGFKEGGIALSRDEGKTWYSKTIAHGNNSKIPQKAIFSGNKYFLNSDSGLLVSSDSGKSWQIVSSPSLLGSDNNPLAVWNIHQNGNSVFLELSSGVTRLSNDSGQTWTPLKPLPASQSSFNWMSIGSDVYACSKEGVYAFNKQTLGWTTFTLSSQPLGKRVRSLRGEGELMIATLTDWPQTAVTAQRTFYVSADSGKSWNELFNTLSGSETVEIVAGKLVRFDNNASELEVSVSQNSGASWQIITLPDALMEESNTDKKSVFFNKSALGIISGRRLSLTTDASLTSWNTFSLPAILKNPTLLQFKVQSDQKFLIFEQALLFTDKNAETWNFIPLIETTGWNTLGVQSSGSHILTWSERGTNAEPAGLFQSKNGGQSFENILANLNLLNGFYNSEQTYSGPSRFERGGYLSPINDISFSKDNIFISTPEGVARASNGSNQFQFLSGPNGQKISSAKDIDSEKNSVAILTKDNRIYLSSDEGQSWKLSHATFGMSASPTKIFLSKKRVFIASEKDLIGSDDFGTTWRDIFRTANVPDGEFINFLATDDIFILITRKNVNEQGVLTNRFFISTAENIEDGFKTQKIPHNIGFVEHIELIDNEIILAGNEQVMAVPKDISQWRSIVKGIGTIKGIHGNKGSLYISSSTGLYVTAPQIPMTNDEIQGSAKISKPIALAPCGSSCPNASSSSGSNSNAGGSGGAPPSVPAKINISSCTFNTQKQKCEYSLSWEDAPENACLWVKIESSLPKLRACSQPDDPTKGSLFLNFVEQNRNYTFILAHVIFNSPGPILAQKTKIFKPELTVSNCSVFNDISPNLCTAQVKWENAPIGGCLWSIHPLTGRTWLAGCSDGVNPTAMTLMHQWMFFGKTNKFFIALQSANPLVPLGAYRYVEAEVVEPSPGGFEGYTGRIHHFCPQDACKDLVMGVVENYSGGVVSGWACQKSTAASVGVDIYVNADPNKPEFAEQNASTLVLAASGTANQVSEAGLSTECGTTGVSHRFSITIPSATRNLYPNTKILAMGKNTLVTNPAPNRELYDPYKVRLYDNRVIGWIDAYDSASGLISGWACQWGVEASIQLKVLAGLTSGSGTEIKTSIANITSEAGVSTSCGTTLGLHRFQITLTPSEKSTYAGKKIYIRGIDTIQNEEQWNLEINNSGNFTIN